MEARFRWFYEDLMTMVREGVPVAVIAQKIRRAVPEHEDRGLLLGHLRDSRDALEAEGRDGPAGTLDRVIESLERGEGP